MNRAMIGIDPGPVESGIVVWNGQCLFADNIQNKTLIESLPKIIGQFNVSLVVIEHLCNQGRASVGQSTFDTAVWIGRFIELAKKRKCSFQLVTRAQIKRWHCGKFIGVTDAKIRASLIAKYGKPGTVPNPGPTHGIARHAWQALAAVTFITEGGKPNIQINEVSQ